LDSLFYTIISKKIGRVKGKKSTVNGLNGFILIPPLAGERIKRITDLSGNNGKSLSPPLGRRRNRGEMIIPLLAGFST